MLNADQIEDFNNAGYLAVADVLAAHELAELRRVTDEFVNLSRKVSSNDETFDLEPGHCAAAPSLRRLKHPLSKHPVYAKYARHQGILDIVECLLGPNLRFHNNKINMKNPGGGSAVEWHQDWAFYPHTNDDLLEVGIALSDMTEENGPLLVLPGSHRGRTWNHHQDGRFVGGITDPAFRPDGAVPVTVPAGGITLHHVRMAHGSRPNRSDKPRRMFFIGFCAADAWPLIPTLPFDEWNARMVRGKPTLTPRLRDLPVRLSLPRAEDGSIYEQQQNMRGALLRASPHA